MSAYGIIGFSQAGVSTAPSGSIWGDCLMEELRYNDQGFLVNLGYDGANPVTPPGLQSYLKDASTQIIYDNVSLDSAILSSTSNGAQNGLLGMWTRPLGPIAKGTGKPFWFEESIYFPSTGTQASTMTIFVGLVGNLGNQSTLVSSTLISNSTTLNNSTSLIGFWMHGSTVNSTMDVVYQKGTPASTGTVSTIATDVFNINPNPAGNVGVNPANNNAAATTAPGNISTSTWYKLGIRYDGNQYLYFYVNGNVIAKAAVDATYDQSTTYGAGQWLYSATSTQTLNVRNGFFRAAFKAR